MATALKIEEPASDALIVIPSAELVLAEPRRGDVVLFNSQAFDQFEAKLREDMKDFVPDLTSAAGRKAIASKAFEVTKVKTTLEKQAKALTEEWRTKTKAVNDGRNVIVSRLEALADEVRAPLTEWEQAEEARIDRCKSVIADIHGAAIVTMDDTSETVRERGMRIWAVEIGEEFGDMGTEAEQAKSATVSTLQAALNRLKKEEADAAELAQLRAENEARIAREAEEQADRDRKAAEIEAARIAEERRVAAEQAEAERIAEVEREAADKARIAAEQAAEAERARIQREHDEAIAVERQRAADAEATVQAEREQAAAVERERQRVAAVAQAERDRIAAEDAERERNKAHRTRVKTAAKQAIMTCGASEDTAQKIVLAIIAGEVPAVSLRF